MINADRTNVTRSAQMALKVVPRMNRWAQARILHRDLGGDLSLRQLSALYLIRDESTTLGDIARRLMVTPAVITGLIDRLEKRGYVKRVSEPGDRRRIHLALTDEGREASHAVEQAIVEDLAVYMAALNDDELGQVERGLAILDRVMNDIESQRGNRG